MRCYHHKYLLQYVAGNNMPKLECSMFVIINFIVMIVQHFIVYINNDEYDDSLEQQC